MTVSWTELSDEEGLSGKELTIFTACIRRNCEWFLTLKVNADSEEEDVMATVLSGKENGTINSLRIMYDFSSSIIYDFYGSFALSRQAQGW